MVINIGENGTFAPGVKVTFDSSRATGYVYQTGVWVPSSWLDHWLLIQDAK